MKTYPCIICGKPTTPNNECCKKCFLKTLIITALILLSLPAFSQGVYVSVGATNQGAQFAAGYENGVRVELSYKKPFTKNDVQTITALTAGYRYRFITPSIGFANTKVIDHSVEGKGMEVRAVKMIYSVSFDWACFFANVNYCDGFYAGAGIRVYFSRL